MEPMIVLLGPPGSGKGTQAERLDGFTRLVSGELLREARRDDPELAESMDRGDLVPDERIVAMMREAIEAAGDRPVVLDGFPRTVAQGEALESELRDIGRELTAVVLIDVPDDVVVERIANRGQGRSDDTPEVARQRLVVYHRDTQPLVGFYEERGLLRRVDGAADPDTVAAGVHRALAH
jgi:adenylate kinase